MSEPVKNIDKKPAAAGTPAPADPVLALLIEQNKALMALVEKMGRVADSSPVEELLKEREEDAEYAARMARIKEEISRPLPERNAALIAQLYSGPRTFTVSIPKAKEFPALKIPANSPEEAEGRYRKFCSITGSDHPFEVAPA